MIDEILNLFMRNKSQFSAYDVTVEMRHHFGAIYPHNTIKSGIHKQVEALSTAFNYEKVNDNGCYFLYQPKTVKPKTDETAAPVKIYFAKVSSMILDAHVLGNKTVSVCFSNGAIYEYKGISESVLKEWVEADSVGHFFNTEIKGKYETNHVN